MRDYLVFRLYGAMTSWGDIAVGEYRPTYDHPSKSAIIGLLEAAAGITREADEKHGEMEKSYCMAVMVNSPGVLLRDYHTTQVPPSGSSRRKPYFATRRAELSTPKHDLKTILSKRDYRCDSLFTICIWTRTEKPPYSLEELKEKLEKPEFTLYLGRKSCPPALPIRAEIINLLSGLELQDTVRVYWEGDEDAGIDIEQSIIRRDVPASRRRWQFSNRTEHYSTINLKGG